MVEILIDPHARRELADPGEAGNPDYVALAEGGYWLGGDDADWMAQLMRHVRVLLGAEVGVFGWGYRLATGKFDLEIRHPTFVDCPEGFMEVMDETTRILGRLDHDGALTRRIYFGPNCLANLAELARPELHDAASVYYEWFQRVGVGGMRMFRADCGDGSGVCLSANRKDDRPLNGAQMLALERAAAHIAAGYRLRRGFAETLGNGASRAGTLEVDAVVATEGKVLHAEGEARDRSCQEGLLQAVDLMQRSRGRLRREDPEKAIGLWRALVSGRWSLIEHLDTDGKRMLLAKKNPPGAVDSKALTVEERAVASYAAYGHSNKLIAYEVGLGESTVSRRLASALKKLGFRSRVELVATLTRARGTDTLGN